MGGTGGKCESVRGFPHSFTLSLSHRFKYVCSFTDIHFITIRNFIEFFIILIRISRTKFSAEFFSTRVIIQPPKPPPICRAPFTPFKSVMAFHEKIRFGTTYFIIPDSIRYGIHTSVFQMHPDYDCFKKSQPRSSRWFSSTINRHLL